MTNKDKVDRKYPPLFFFEGAHETTTKTAGEGSLIACIYLKEVIHSYDTKNWITEYKLQSY